MNFTKHVCPGFPKDFNVVDYLEDKAINVRIDCAHHLHADTEFWEATIIEGCWYVGIRIVSVHDIHVGLLWKIITMNPHTESRSDRELNIACAEKLGAEKILESHNSQSVAVLWGDKRFVTNFNPCNSWSGAYC